MGTKQFSNYSDLLTFTRASKGHALRPVSYGTELVTNGDYSNGTTGWTNDSSLTMDTFEVASGRLHIENTAGTTQAAYTDDNISLVAGKIYKFTAELEKVSGNDNWDIDIRVAALSTVRHTMTSTATTETLQVIFVATQTENTVIQITTRDTFEGYIDNVSVKEVFFDQTDGTLTLFEHPNNIPRVEWDADRNRLGLLVEEARTNLITHSHLDGANPTGWTTFSLGGTRTATTLYGLPAIRFQATAERPLLQLPLTLSASTTYTISCYIENTGGTTEEIMQLNGFSGVSGDSRIYTNEVDSKGYISNTFTTGTDASGYLRLGLGVGSSATGDVTITAIQIEQASFGTSYIKTTGSTATRSADVASIPVANFGYNTRSGSFLAEFSHTDPNGTTDTNYLLSVASDARFLYNNSSNAGWYSYDGTASLSYGNLASDGTVLKVATSMYKDGSNASIDGGTIKTSTASPQDNVATSDDLYIGVRYSGSGDQLNGHIKSIKYYPRRLTNAQLQDITS